MKSKINVVLLISSIVLLNSGIYSQNKKDLIDLLFRANEITSTANMGTCNTKDISLLEKSSHLFPNEPEAWPMKTAWKEKDYKSFKLFDFTGDGKIDLIYSGYFGSEECLNYLWVQTEKGFSFIGEIGGDIKFMRNSKNDMFTIVSRCNYSSDGNRFGNFIQYKIEKNKNNYKIVILENIQEYLDIYIPQQRIDESKILITKDNSSLRSGLSNIDSIDKDESAFYSMPVYGNLLAKINKGSIGLVIAKENDKKGDAWYLVLFNSNTKVTYTRFNKTNEGKILGWINSKFTKFIN
jgi:hypothetical protein